MNYLDQSFHILDRRVWQNAVPQIEDVSTVPARLRKNRARFALDLGPLPAPGRLGRRRRLGRRPRLDKLPFLLLGTTLALIAAPDLSACGFSSNPFLAQHLRRFLDILVREDEGRAKAA